MKNRPLPIVSARSVKIGPSVLLTGSSAPVVESFLKITPDAGDVSGIMDRAVAIFALTALLKTVLGAVTRKLFALPTAVPILESERLARNCVTVNTLGAVPELPYSVEYNMTLETLGAVWANAAPAINEPHNNVWIRDIFLLVRRICCLWF